MAGVTTAGEWPFERATQGPGAARSIVATSLADMNRSLSLVLGALLVVMGLVWFLQGIGVLGGSAMSGVVLWAVIGPIVAVAGVFLILRGRRGKPDAGA